MITVQAFINIIDWRLYTMKRVILNPIKVDKVVENVDNSVHSNNIEADKTYKFVLLADDEKTGAAECRVPYQNFWLLLNDDSFIISL